MNRLNHKSLQLVDRTAINQVCAWPNLTLLPDDAVLAAVFNQPCHGKWAGDLDGWVSTDRGDTWELAATIAPRDSEDANRMNCAVGDAVNSDLVALCSGWANRVKRGEEPVFGRENLIDTRVYRSSDQGQSWQAGESFPELGIPFGDIYPVEGRLVSSAYCWRGDQFQPWVIESTDDGHSWEVGATIAERGDETSLLPLAPDRWLAAVRSNGVSLAVSEDQGASWRITERLTLPAQQNGHLRELQDGTILLSFGNRCLNNYGVDARLSHDRGETWSAPFRLADTPRSDCGYPSTVQFNDGSLLTAYYTKLPGEYRYEMRATQWQPFWT